MWENEVLGGPDDYKKFFGIQSLLDAHGDALEYYTVYLDTFWFKQRNIHNLLFGWIWINQEKHAERKRHACSFPGF